jgi:hypothetical protein
MTLEEYRRQLQQLVNEEPKGREELEKLFGEVWDTQELQACFDVDSFRAPFVHVRAKTDGKSQTLMFQHRPRLYFPADLTVNAVGFAAQVGAWVEENLGDDA